MGAFTKRWTIDRRRARRQRLDMLRKRYAAAKSDVERTEIFAKAHQVSPQMSQAEFLGPLQSKSAARQS